MFWEASRSKLINAEWYYIKKQKKKSACFCWMAFRSRICILYSVADTQLAMIPGSISPHANKAGCVRMDLIKSLVTRCLGNYTTRDQTSMKAGSLLASWILSFSVALWENRVSRDFCLSVCLSVCLCVCLSVLFPCLSHSTSLVVVSLAGTIVVKQDWMNGKLQSLKSDAFELSLSLLVIVPLW